MIPIHVRRNRLRKLCYGINFCSMVLLFAELCNYSVHNNGI
uniref:Uncharacterized protein n=1 Tax=Rhizophora mucronata TaxID=61149 RepID=A0A2P2KQT7_RHIMU